MQNDNTGKLMTRKVTVELTGEQLEELGYMIWRDRKGTKASIQTLKATPHSPEWAVDSLVDRLELQDSLSEALQAAQPVASSQPQAPEGLDPETQIDDLVDRHLEAMVREIQDRLGVETGDQAAWFFSGRWDDLKDEVTPLMQAYAQSEIELD
jgi:hypothetical protein